MAFVYAVLGGGRQGTAAAYDMARFGETSRVLIADVDLEAARKSAARERWIKDDPEKRNDGPNDRQCKPEAATPRERT